MMNKQGEILKILKEQRKFLDKDYTFSGEYTEMLQSILDYCKKTFYSKKKQQSFKKFLKEVKGDYESYQIIPKNISNIDVSKFSNRKEIKDFLYETINQHIINIYDQLKSKKDELQPIDFDISEDSLVHYIGENKWYGKIQERCDQTLQIVERNLTYLTQDENLPQLGFLMKYWENLFYSGRRVFGYDITYGNEESWEAPLDIYLLDFTGQCENNPKYEIEDGSKISYNNQKEEDLVYDAWCTVADYGGGEDKNTVVTAEMFEKMKVSIKPELTEFEILLGKKNKTFDEWVQLMTDDRYRYNNLFPNKFEVESYLLCCYGTGYDWNKDGFICEDMPSGNDKSIYNGWEYAYKDLPPQIQREFNEINSDPIVIKTLQLSYECSDFYIQQKKEKDKKMYSDIFDDFDDSEDVDVKELLKSLRDTLDSKDKKKKKKVEEKESYYPISDGYSLCSKIPDNVDISYIAPIVNVVEESYKNPSDDYVKDEALKIMKKYPKYFRMRKINDIISESE
jgi:hypothetical protein